MKIKRRVINGKVRRIAETFLGLPFLRHIAGMQNWAVIVAGGSGTRMGAPQPKQFMELQGKPLLVHTVQAFLDADPGIIPVIVLPASWMDLGRGLLLKFIPEVKLRFTTGGETRFHSVQNGLKEIEGDGLVFVHDAVRCLVSPTLIRRCATEAMASGSAIPAVSVKDSLRVISASGHHPINREMIRAIQTPQTFRTEILLPAFNQPYHAGFTDEATVVEATGGQVTLVEGEETNIKVTVPADLLIAQEFLKQRLSIGNPG
jgi:2-C-methyl-D-erythritol 4-phosphate cytidylyltransferase